MTDEYTRITRPGYFGRRRDQKVAEYNAQYGAGNWELRWAAEDLALTFETACKRFYERSYYEYLSARPELVDWICSYGECIDNAPTNVTSGLDYTKQEAFSTHIQDIAVRNVLRKLSRSFEGPQSKVLVIRSKDSDGYKIGPGNVPFYDAALIHAPSKCPDWANAGSVEDFWQSNKYLYARVPNVE